MAPVAVALLHPQRVQRVVAGVAQPVRGARRDEYVEHTGRELGGDVQLPAQFAHVGDTAGAHPCVAEVDLTRPAEREGLVGKAVGRRRAGQRLQQVARVGAHHTEHRVRRGDVGGHHPRLGGKVILEVAEVAHLRGRCGHDQVAIGRQPSDGEIGLDAAALVEPLGVDDLADGHGHIVRADPVQHCLGIGAFQLELAERRLLEHADCVAHRMMLCRRVGEPVLLAVGVLVLGLHTLGGEPVGAFPARHLTEARAARRQPIVQRRATNPARRRRLEERPVHRVEQTQ